MMAPFENFRHDHDAHRPGAAKALHVDTEDELGPPGHSGRLGHIRDTKMLYCDEVDTWEAVAGAPHLHENEHAPGRVLSNTEVATLDAYLANGEPTLAETVDVVKALASVLRRT